MTPKEAYNVLNSAQVYLISNRAEYDHSSWQRACMLLAFGKEVAKRTQRNSSN